MRRWIGFLGSWALLILALGLTSVAAAAEWINIHDLQRLDRVKTIDPMIDRRINSATAPLRRTAAERAAEVSALQNKMQWVESQTNDVPDTGQEIIVSTEEHKLYVRRNGQTIFEAPCATGMGTSLAADGKTWVFDTPIGKFRILSKEKDPLWVPPDWHYVEEARRDGMHVVHLEAGTEIDARTGEVVTSEHHGFWSWMSGGNSDPILEVKGNIVVEDDHGSVHELPAGQEIVAGDAVVIPPLESPQRHFPGVLGHYRLELGNGYGIHGTDEPDKIGQSVSHGCVRLGDADIAKLYAMSNVGDTVIIY